MSANTRRERNEDLAKLASLHAQAVSFIEKGQREPAQVRALLSSLQFFKENRLLAAIPKQPGEMLPEPDLLQRLLSMKLADTGINRKTLARLHGGGVEYVGELYLMVWPRRTGIAKNVHDLLSSLGLPHELDLNGVGWVPPYATNDFFWWMNQPPILFIKDDSDAVWWVIDWYNSFAHTGELFQVMRREWNYGPRFSTDTFRRVFKGDARLRAGLYCPKTWAPPTDPPK